MPHRLRWVRAVSSLIVLLLPASSALAQEYVYPNKKLCDQGLLEYRRYTMEEAQAFEEGGSFAPYTTLGWGPERRLTEQENVYRARVVTSGDSLFCSYSRINNDGSYFIRSLDAGLNWGSYIFLGDTTRVLYHYFPEILHFGNELVIGQMVHWVLHGYNLSYYKSTDNGVSWSPINEIFAYYYDDLNHYSSFGGWGQRIYGSYRNFDEDSIYVVRSLDWGNTWNGLGVNVAYLSSTPQAMTVRAWGDNVYLVWVNENQPISCRYSRSTDRGQTWSDEIDISNDSSGAQRVYVAVQDSHMVVSWNGFKYSPYGFTGDLFIKQSFDGGETWGDEQVLTDLHKVWMGSVYIKDSLLVATWQDTRFEGGNNEVMVIFSHDYGQTWTEEERLSYADYDSHSPISCSTGDKIHVLWGDMRLSAPGLYYCVNDPSTVTIEDENPKPENIYLNIYPNPFNSKTLITYRDIQGGNIGIYSITGRLIKTLTVNRKGGTIMWDSTDDKGNHVSSGVYFLRARTSNGETSRKVVFLK